MKKWITSLFVGFLVTGFGCGDAQVTTQVSLRVDSAWGSDLDHVKLLFVFSEDNSTDCTGLAYYPEQTADMLPSCPGDNPCLALTHVVSQNPGDDGEALFVPVGDLSLLAYGFNTSNAVLGQDCVAVHVVEGESTEIHLNL